MKNYYKSLVSTLCLYFFSSLGVILYVSGKGFLKLIGFLQIIASFLFLFFISSFFFYHYFNSDFYKTLGEEDYEAWDRKKMKHKNTLKDKHKNKTLRREEELNNNLLR